MTNERPFRQQSLSDKGERFYLDADKVRKVEISHEPPTRERVRVTVEYVTGEVKALTVHKSLLSTVLEELYAAESETQRRGMKSEPDA